MWDTGREDRREGIECGIIGREGECRDNSGFISPPYPGP